MNRIHDAIASLVVGICWWVDRRMCRWAVVTHEPQENEE
jgi:hypothetical protein